MHLLLLVKHPLLTNVLFNDLNLLLISLAPLGGRLSDSVPVRVMALVGGVILSTSLSCTALARHLGVVVFTFGMVGE